MQTQGQVTAVGIQRDSMQLQAHGGIDIFAILGTIYTWVGILLTPTVLLLILWWILRKYSSYHWQLAQSRNSVLLAITPPVASKRTPHATEELFIALWSLGNSRSLHDRFLAHMYSFSFELVSTRREGIRFAVRVSRDKVATLKHKLASYTPDGTFEEIPDYLVEATERVDLNTWLNEFKQSRDYALPLAPHDVLSQHDPIGYLGNAMAKPDADELICYQMVIEPVQLRRVIHIRNQLQVGKHPDIYGRNHAIPLKLLLFVICLPFRIFTIIMYALSDLPVSGGSSQGRRYESQREPELSEDSKKLLATVSDKLAQPLFKVSLRTLVVSKDVHRGSHSSDSIGTALNSLSVAGLQSLVAKGNFPKQLTHKYRRFRLLNRMPTFFVPSSCIFSPSELASLYHFPYGDDAQPENLVQSTSKSLPASTALKSHHDDADFDVLLGVNKYHGGYTDIGLTLPERERHMYVIGGTGNGKTTMLQYAIVQDIEEGRGVAVIDPHGDMAKELLNYIPQERIKDVIYLNPRDMKYPVGLNLLQLQPEDDPDELAMQKSQVTESIVSVLRKIFSDDESNAHRIEGMLRNTILTALTVEDATLFTVLKILRNKKYRDKVVGKLTDPDLKDFWREEMSAAGGMQFVSMTKGVTNRLDRFISSPPAKRMLIQPKSTIDFEDIMDSGKILICNFAQGEIGEDTTALFGTMVLAKLKLAAERRIRMAQAERTPFYVYVDEFQTFATTPFLKLLSGSRKFKLYVTIAQQSTTQQEEVRMTEQILSNVSTVVTFRTGSPTDEKLLLPRFQPQLAIGDIGNLPAYHFYLRTQALQSHPPVSGMTVILAGLDGAAEADEVIASSRKLYGGIIIEEDEASKDKPKRPRGGSDGGDNNKDGESGRAKPKDAA